MTIQSIIILVLTIALIVFLILFIVFKLLFGMMKKRFGKFLEEPLFQNSEMRDGAANFFGTQSFGRMQIRGNGLFALTNEAIVFKMYAGKREVHIKYSDIISVETADSFLGKTIFRKTLLVRYKTVSGEDSSAWYIRNPEVWIEKIKAHLPAH